MLILTCDDVLIQSLRPSVELHNQVLGLALQSPVCSQQEEKLLPVGLDLSLKTTHLEKQIGFVFLHLGDILWLEQGLGEMGSNIVVLCTDSSRCFDNSCLVALEDNVKEAVNPSLDLVLGIFGPHLEHRKEDECGQLSGELLEIPQLFDQLSIVFVPDSAGTFLVLSSSNESLDSLGERAPDDALELIENLQDALCLIEVHFDNFEHLPFEHGDVFFTTAICHFEVMGYVLWLGFLRSFGQAPGHAVVRHRHGLLLVGAFRHHLVHLGLQPAHELFVNIGACILRAIVQKGVEILDDAS